MKGDADKMLSNINVSFIYTPLTLDDFKMFLKDNGSYLERNGLEVIIGIRRTINKSKILKKILEYPFVNWKILSGENESISSLVNICIANAVKNHVLLLGPYTRINQALLFRLKYIALNYSNVFITIGSIKRIEGFAQHIDSPGILFAERTSLLKANGLEEGEPWIHSMANLVRRLQRFGMKRYRYRAEIEENAEDLKLENSSSRNHQTKLLYPSENRAINSRLAEPKCSLLYSWAEASCAQERCMKYLKKFKQYEVKNSNFFTTHYRVIALLQTYNEMRNMPQILQHLENYCDGIILLDDGSADGTYENAVSSKLLLKVQKKRNGFDDLLNRNILFNLVSFFKVDWIYTMDADERFDPRYDAIFNLVNSPYDIIEFPYVNLWNSNDTYRVNYATSEKADGIFYRKRMYRNIGRVKVPRPKKLHFNPVPHTENVGRVKVLILHYGILSDENRKNKYDSYIKEDSSPEHFKYIYKPLLEIDVVLGKVENIDLDKIILSSRSRSEINDLIIP